MQLGIIGLGRMGGNIVRRLMRAGHATVVFDRDAKAVATLAGETAVGASGLRDVVGKLARPRAVWIMLPAGAVTEATVAELAGLLEAGDIIIDGGNSFWKDDIRRARELKAKGMHYVDVGTSGGVWGLERGYCMMIGGDKAAVEHLDPDLRGAGAGRRRHPADADAPGARPARRARLHPCRPERRRPLRQDDPQRHRVRPDAGLCRRLRHPAQRQFAGAAGGGPARSRPRRHRRSVAARQRHLLLAPRSHRHRAGRGHVPVDLFGPCRGFRRGPLDPARPPSTRRCRPRCCRPRSMPASARARSTPSPRRSSPPCARGSAATSSPKA